MKPENGTDAQPLGVYIHVPFCRVHCPYCDFYTYPHARGRQDDFVSAIIREIRQIHHRLRPHRFCADTVYFGGGTPSLLSPARVKQIMQALRDALAVDRSAEVTLEANPEDLNPHYLDELLTAGINRLSVGIQSFDARVLGLLGRACDPGGVTAALKLVSAWPNWSADLMFGWEGQTMEQWSQELEAVLQYAPPHVSLYQLTLEPRTRFGVLAGLGRMNVADRDLQADLYLNAVGSLESAGLAQYEVSNFAREGMRSRHNSAYWVRRPYVGLGPSAHSLLWGRRTENVRSLPGYVRRLERNSSPVAQVEVLSPAEELTERVWLGLRTREGIPETWIATEAMGFVQKSQKQGMLRRTSAGHYVLTTRGMAVADEMVARLLGSADSGGLPDNGQ